MLRKDGREGERERSIDLNGDLINFVEGIDAGNVNSISLDDINEIVSGSVTAEDEVSVVDLVFSANSLDLVVLNHSHRDLRNNKKVNQSVWFLPVKENWVG